ncbi:DNA methyltransferase [Neisseriaceae bacterium TC5R-5]|nr:DNA methyltransferase [Neisseriaceae bacterium TC5R-5]
MSIALPQQDDFWQTELATLSTTVSRPGDVWSLDAHRLVCGDAADPAMIQALMQGQVARLCFTSPPYGQQRHYGIGVTDWDALMDGVFAVLPLSPDAQVLVNLGLVHQHGEVVPYWDHWINWMQQQGWRRFGWYVWDQGHGLPGDWHGRLAPCFEFIFHFNKTHVRPNKIVPCKGAGTIEYHKASLRSKDESVPRWTHEGIPIQSHRIPDAVVRLVRQRGGIGKDIQHPAVFPITLPTFIFESYSQPGDAVFEPFCGSGSTLIAAQQTQRVCYAVELSPHYVDTAIKRFRQHFPTTPVRLLSSGQDFMDVAAERHA